MVTRFAMRPRRVGTIIALAEIDSAKVTAALAICCLSSLISKLSVNKRPLLLSVERAIRSSISTHFIGYLPTVVSPDNIIASDSSYTALATSVTSARVGIGFSIIDSSMCVATITRLPISAQVRIIRR